MRTVDGKVAYGNNRKKHLGLHSVEPVLRKPAMGVFRGEGLRLAPFGSEKNIFVIIVNVNFYTIF